MDFTALVVGQTALSSRALDVTEYLVQLLDGGGFTLQVIGLFLRLLGALHLLLSYSSTL